MSGSYFFLLLSRKNSLHKDEITSIFWRDSVANASSRLNDTVYKLRRVLGKYGKQIILSESQLFKFNRNIDYEYDVEVFMSKIEIAGRKEAPDEKIPLLKEAFECYEDQFLPDAGHIWAVNEREHIKQKFIGIGITLAENALVENDPSQALAYCDRLFTTDDALEDVYILAMSACKKLRRPKEINRYYQQYLHAMEKLGFPVSQHVEQFYKNLAR